MALVEDRLREIEQKYAHLVQDLLVLRLTEETFRLVLLLKNGTTPRVAERWQAGQLTRYSYYWLDTQDSLKIGWDNAPHHTRLNNFPHHKHVTSQANIQPSFETCLEDVMAVILDEP